MILGWIRRDGMARMLMTGVVDTDPIEWSMHLLGRCLLVNYYWMSDISTQLILEKYDNEQPLERLLKIAYIISQTYIFIPIDNTSIIILSIHNIKQVSSK
jgi:hypothetical protein